MILLMLGTSSMHILTDLFSAGWSRDRILSEITFKVFLPFRAVVVRYIWNVVSDSGFPL